LRLKILKKLRTASLNSEFTGSYKKVYTFIQFLPLNTLFLLIPESIKVHLEFLEFQGKLAN